MNCIDAGNVFVHLFLQTKTQYVLTNKKLQYLLIIAQMSRLAYGRTLFEDDIRNFKNGFVLDVIGNSFMSGCDIVSGQTNDMPLNLDAGEFILPCSKKKMFEIVTMPSEADKRLLIRVFLAFGSYDEKTLNRLLNEFKTLRNVQTYSVLSPMAIRKFFSAGFAEKKYGANPIFSFVKQQGPARPQVIPQNQAIPQNERFVPTPVCSVPVEPAVVSPAYVPVEPVGAVTNLRVAEEAPVAPALLPRVILKKLSSLKNIRVGKQYSVWVEVSSPGCDCEVTVVAVDLKQQLPVVRNMVTETLYSFTFEGVASNIQISARIIP